MKLNWKLNQKLCLSLVLVSMVGCGKTNEGEPVALTQAQLAAERIEMRNATVSECPQGGTSLQTYIDANANSKLDSDERVLSSSVICAGANGADGKDGEDGKDGSNGKDGADGSDGKDGQSGQDGVSPYSLVFKILAEAPSCKFGGSTIIVALDSNRNGELDEKDEHSSSVEICNGADGKDAEVPAPDFSCKVKLSHSSIWDDGYVVDVEFVYHGPLRTGWAMNFVLPPSHNVVDVWNAEFSGKSGTIQATHMSYNSTLKEGSKTQFGFKVERPNTQEIISAKEFKLNGVACES